MLSAVVVTTLLLVHEFMTCVGTFVGTSPLQTKNSDEEWARDSMSFYLDTFFSINLARLRLRIVGNLRSKQGQEYQQKNYKLFHIVF